MELKVVGAAQRRRLSAAGMAPNEVPAPHSQRVDAKPLFVPANPMGHGTRADVHSWYGRRPPATPGRHRNRRGPLLKAAARAADRYDAEPAGTRPVRSLYHCTRARSHHALTLLSHRAPSRVHERTDHAYDQAGAMSHTSRVPALTAIGCG